ncbi:MAG: hypothetical protein H6667_14330 [Ardenticatenaceae bacterium]|nr:hypothetical protein [Ardenticatenaceae bacterium]MCB9444232.1 hypothetical protein [Ardenticatenaceae bacterium]
MKRKVAQILSKVEEALQAIDSYRLRTERNDKSGYSSVAEVDTENKAVHSIIHVGIESPREVEFYWVGQQAYGLPRHIGTWFKVWVPDEPPSRLNSIFAILKTGEIPSLQEETINDEACWHLSVTPNLSYLKENISKYADAFSPVSGEGSPNDDEELHKRIEQALREVEFQTEFWISQKTHYIIKASVSTSFPNNDIAAVETTYLINHVNDPWLTISPPADALQAEGPYMSLGLLFTHLAGFKPGWMEHLHCTMTEEALKLIKKEDKKERYSEIYEGWGGPPFYHYKSKSESKPSKSDHPCVQGAWAEDAGGEEPGKQRIDFVTNPADMIIKNFRDFRHFGGEDKGLAWKDYFALRSEEKAKVEKPKNGVCYISAKNWGYDGGGCADKMNFQGAIDAYNHYTPVGRREAYYRMGHVLHLLQDLAQPDHASLVDHAGSSLTEPEAYAKFYVCLAQFANVLEIETAVLCSPCFPLIIFGDFSCLVTCELTAGQIAAAAYGICEASTDSDQIGFERLVTDHWNFNRIDKDKELKVMPEVNYNAFFKNMAKESIDELTSEGRNLKCPLGLGSLYVGLLAAGGVKIAGKTVKPFGTIPGVDPDIELGNPVGTGEDKPYLELADKVIVKAINRSAGLLQHFYEIVNFPPYIKSVTIAQGEKNLDASAVLANPQNFIYTAEWKDKLISSNLGGRVSSRELVVKKEPINKAHLIKAPNIYVVTQVRGKIDQLSLEAKNCQDVPIDSCKMEVVSGSLSTYNETAYFAKFSTNVIASGMSKVCDALVLEFTGEDTEPHFSQRNYPGNKLDSDPATPAMAELASPHHWTDYVPGTDKNHRLRIISADKTENNIPDSINNPTIVTYPSKLSGPLSLLQLTDLTIHDVTDIDFFLLQLPTKTDTQKECENTEEKKGVGKIPGSLSIFVNAVNCLGNIDSSGVQPQIVFHKKDGTPFSQFEIPVVKTASGFTASISNEKLEKYFADGDVLFSIRAFEAICYEMNIRHYWCTLVKDMPPLIYERPKLNLGYLPDPPPDFLESQLKRWFPFSFPSTMENNELMARGMLSRPEYFVLQRSEEGKLQIDVQINAPEPNSDLEIMLLNSSGEMLAEAKLLNPTFFSELVARPRGISHNTPRLKQIDIDNLEAGTYIIKVSGKSGPLSYSLRFAPSTTI